MGLMFAILLHMLVALGSVWLSVEVTAILESTKPANRTDFTVGAALLCLTGGRVAPLAAQVLLGFLWPPLLGARTNGYLCLCPGLHHNGPEYSWTH